MRRCMRRGMKAKCRGWRELAWGGTHGHKTTRRVSWSGTGSNPSGPGRVWLKGIGTKGRAWNKNERTHGMCGLGVRLLV